MNSIKVLAIGCLGLLGLLGITVFTMQLEFEETNGRVAALEQRNDELQGELSSTTDALNSTTDALYVYQEENASLTDAYEELKNNVTLIQEDTTEEEKIVEDTKGEITKSVNNDTVVEASDNQEVYEVVPFQSTEVESYEEETTESSEYTYYGTKQLTAYCATGNACADGVMPSVGYTVASNDPALWHRWIYIEGIGDRYVHDTGGMSSSVIDIFMGSYSECIQFGRQSAKIYIYN